MAKPAARIALVQAVVVLALLGLVARAAQVQLIQRDQWVEAGKPRRLAVRPLPARRGTILDRSGRPLAVSQQFYHVNISFPQVRDTARLVSLASRHLGVRPAAMRQAVRTRRDYYLHGPWSASQIDSLRPLRGVHLESVYLRHYPAGGLARPVIGTLHPDSGYGTSGLERAFDSLLAGRAGEAVFLRDGAGRLYQSPSRRVREPVEGADVVLTIDTELQGIAETGLTDAIAEYAAEGGDVVFLDIRTGEVLAAASQLASGTDHRAGATVFTAPFEPGSTAKLFTAAGLLSRQRVDSTRTVSGENGRWAMPVSSTRVRILEDTHAEREPLTLQRAVQVSSNIAMAKFSQLLAPEEQYETLRDFGFGAPTGVEFPGEAPGRLARPHRWNAGYSGPSHAIGYEFGVTAIQLAAAYAAIANEGVLLAPTLVREIRDPDGTTRYRHVPEVVRRVITADVAARLRYYLQEAAGVEGTGSRVQLANVSVLGKTGTARLFEGGAYQPGKFTASFAGIFPAHEPQLVVIARLTNPRGGYGGLTAAPLTRRMLEEALAARESALDRRALGARTAPAPDRAPAPSGEPAPLQVVDLPVAGKDSLSSGRPVPEVSGRSVREAVLLLHRRGFRVRVTGSGVVRGSRPAAGATLAPGATVQILAGDAP